MALQYVCMQSGLSHAQTLQGLQDVVYAVRFVSCAQILEGFMESWNTRAQPGVYI